MCLLCLVPPLFFPIICSAAASFFPFLSFFLSFLFFLFVSFRFFVTPLPLLRRAPTYPLLSLSLSYLLKQFFFLLSLSSFPSLARLLYHRVCLSFASTFRLSTVPAMNPCRGNGATARRPLNGPTRPLSIHSAAISWREYE